MVPPEQATTVPIDNGPVQAGLQPTTDPRAAFPREKTAVSGRAMHQAHNWPLSRLQCRPGRGPAQRTMPRRASSGRPDWPRVGAGRDNGPMGGIKGRPERGRPLSEAGGRGAAGGGTGRPEDSGAGEAALWPPSLPLSLPSLPPEPRRELRGWWGQCSLQLGTHYQLLSREPGPAGLPAKNLALTLLNSSRKPGRSEGQCRAAGTPGWLL